MILPDKRARDRGATRRLMLALFLIVFGVVALSSGGHTSSSDEETMLATTRALLHGQAALNVSPDNQPLLAVRSTAKGPVGVYGIGESVVILPAYLAGAAVAHAFPSASTDLIERLFADFTGSWLAGLLAVVIFLAARELGAPNRGAAALGLVAILGTGLWPEAKTMFSELLTALLTITAVLLAIRAARMGSFAAALLSGAAIGAAPMARSTSILFVLPLALYLLTRPRISHMPGRRHLGLAALFAFGAAITLGLFLLTNWWRYGSPFDNGYPPQNFSYPLASGLFGLFLSPGKSLFLYAPLVVVAVASIPLSLRRFPAETLLLIALSVITLPIYATFHDWHGDNAWGPRYLYSILPLLLVIVAPVLGSFRWRVAAGIATALGVVINLAGVLLFFNVYIGYVGNQVGPSGLQRDPIGEFIYYDDMHFDVQYSPAINQWRLVPSALKRSALELSGRANTEQPFPSATLDRFAWYFNQPKLDTWWYLVIPTRTPAALEALVPVFVACIGVGGMVLVRELRAKSSSADRGIQAA